MFPKYHPNVSIQPGLSRSISTSHASTDSHSRRRRLIIHRTALDAWRVGISVVSVLPDGRKRPGVGISATTNYHRSDLLYVFSTSTVFEAGRSYSKFGAYTILEHGGNFSAAARILAAQGYTE